MMYINAFLYKEFFELKSEWKKIASLLFITLIPLISLYNDKFAFISKEIQVKYLLLLVPFAVCGQLSSNLIESEKKARTLEIILSNDIPKYSIYIGKALPSMIIGYIYFILSTMLFGFISSFFSQVSFFTIELNLILIGLFISFFSTAISFLVNILVQDQRFVPILSIIIIGIIIMIMYLVNKLIKIDYSSNFCILVVIGLCISGISIYFLSKIKRLII